MAITKRKIEFKSLSRPDITSILTEAGQAWCQKYRYSCHPELGIAKRGRLRADIFALNMKGHVIQIECKSGRPDMRTDKKWRTYLDYCNKFYFLVDHTFWEKSEAYIRETVKGSGAGVLVCSPLGNVAVKVRATEQTLHHARAQRLYIKAAWRGGNFKE